MQLNVPLIKQDKKCDCWHAAALMLYGYKRAQTVDPLPELYAKKDCGVALSNYMDFIAAAHLRTLTNPAVSLTPNMVQDMLASHGPLIFIIETVKGSNHALVVTGADKDNVYYNDPYYGVENLDWDAFNSEVDHLYPIAYLN